jgi:phosphate-selective porin OprO/OprP
MEDKSYDQPDMSKKPQVCFSLFGEITKALVLLFFCSGTVMAALPTLPEFPELADAAEAPKIPEDILVRNVILIDPAAKSEDSVVNMLIKGGQLEVISEDKISSDEASLVLDANGGFILGKLEVGAAPSFIILDTDPRTVFDVMLDTKRYSSFAVRDGFVVKNRLLDEFESDPDEEPVKSGWLAYTPPPFALPLNYQDTSKWNRFDSKYISGIFVSAMVLDRTNWLSQNDASESQFGDLDFYSGGEIRGFRLGMVGTLNMFEKPWIYTLFGATNAFDKGFEIEEQDTFALFDWRLDIPFLNNSVMSIGKQKEPISGERIQSMAYNQMQERSSVSDALLPSRNVGMVWNGSSPDTHSTWAFGAFNDWFDADQKFSESASQLIGRLTWAPLKSKDESNLVHLGAGYRYSDGKEGFRYLTEPEFNKAPVFVDTGIGTETGRLPADSTRSWNLELSWRKGPFLLSSEYTRSDVKNPLLGNPRFDGYWVAASWVLTGEMRPYNKKSGTFGTIPISRGVYQSGKGAWELSTRFSHINLNDHQIMGGEMDVASLGLSWWLTPFFNVNANYRYIWNEFDGQNGISSGVNTRIVLVLE